MFLDAFWIDFSSIFHRFLAPKIHKKCIKKSLQKLIAFGIDFGSIFGGFCLPNGGWKGLGFLYIFAVGALLGPSWAQDRPRPLQEASWDRFWQDFEPLGTDFERILEPNLVDFGRILVPTTQPTHQSTNTPINQHTNQPTKQPSKQPTDQTSRHPYIPRRVAVGRRHLDIYIYIYIISIYLCTYECI